jgi:hypothetical protein
MPHTLKATRRDVLKLVGVSPLVALTIPLPSDATPTQRVTILVDDFVPQPIAGTVEWFYSRLDADRGRINVPDGGTVELGPGVARAQLVAPSFVGMYFALQHTQREGLPLTLSSVFPAYILPAFQGRVMSVRAMIAAGRGTLQIELGQWRDRAALTGGPQVLEFVVPPLGEIQSLNWVLIGNVGDFVEVTRIELQVELPRLPLEQRAFLFSFAQLLANLDEDTGLVRDRAGFPAGDFDAVPAGGLLAAATVQAWSLGLMTRSSAEQIVDSITSGLLALRRMRGLLPHFVSHRSITPGTEYSTVDFGLATLPLIGARQALSMDPVRTGLIEQMIVEVDWKDLTFADGRVSHGFTESGQRIAFRWGVFGGETWIVNLLVAAATGNVLPMDAPPTFNGSAFIVSLPWLFLPPPSKDAYGINWRQAECRSALEQTRYYQAADHQQDGYAREGVFGLSAGEVPTPWTVPPSAIYQAFGTGGRIPANDGTALLGEPVVIPHASAMLAAMKPREARRVWRWLLEETELMTPLNNVESLTAGPVASCAPLKFNSLRGSLNLGLQTLGWGRYLTGEANPLYAAAATNPFLKEAYRRLSQ